MSSLRDRLYDQQQTPPEEVWKRIATALDESHLQDQFPSKLYNTEVTPPVDAWNRIAESMEPGAVSMSRRNFSILRYAAAAILIGLLSFGVIKWMNRGSTKTADTVAVNNNNANTKNKKQAESGKVDATPEIISPGQVNSDVKNTELAVTTVKKARTHYNAPVDNDIEPIYAYNEHTPADRYIMYMTPDGGVVRMSKKWGSLVCCVSGQEQDEDCKDQIKKWQEKLACAPVGNSNFMDILSLVNTLNTDL